MYDLQFRALSKAWLVTMVAVGMFGAAVMISQVWDARVFFQALEDTLVHNEI